MVKVQATVADAYKLVHEGILALARAERRGIRIDVEYCIEKQQYLTRKVKYYQDKLSRTNFFRRWEHIYKGKVNVLSDDQLATVLYRHMKLTPPKMTTSGRGATDEESLKQLNVPELQYIIQIRKLMKIRDTYLGQFIRETNKDGYMRPSFNLHTVRTYRSSSSDPNFQNIPKRDKEAMEICRRAILPRPDHMLMEADFSALEVMISVCYHRDPVMINYLQDPAADMHLDMAKQIYINDELEKSSVLRQGAKNGFVFPQFYGDYYGNCARYLCEWGKLPVGSRWKNDDGVELANGEHLGAHMRRNQIKSFDAFVEHMKHVEDDFWNRRFNVYNQWRKTWIQQYRENGYFQMLTGFRCSGLMRKNEIVNYPVQGTAFHCLLQTFIYLEEVAQEQGWDSRLVGQIHDSIVLDANPDELHHIQAALDDIVGRRLPEQWDWIVVPLEIEIDEYAVNGPWIKE